MILKQSEVFVQESMFTSTLMLISHMQNAWRHRQEHGAELDSVHSGTHLPGVIVFRTSTNEHVHPAMWASQPRFHSPCPQPLCWPPLLLALTTFVNSKQLLYLSESSAVETWQNQGVTKYGGVWQTEKCSNVLVCVECCENNSISGKSSISFGKVLSCQILRKRVTGWWRQIKNVGCSGSPDVSSIHVGIYSSVLHNITEWGTYRGL